MNQRPVDDQRWTDCRFPNKSGKVTSHWGFSFSPELSTGAAPLCFQGDILAAKAGSTGVAAVQTLLIKGDACLFVSGDMTKIKLSTLTWSGHLRLDAHSFPWLKVPRLQPRTQMLLFFKEGIGLDDDEETKLIGNLTLGSMNKQERQ